MNKSQLSDSTPGAKLDAGKPDMSLLQLFGDALYEVAKVGTFGAEKYSRGGFLLVPNGPTRYSAAMLRHYFLELIEGTFDKDPYYDTPAGQKWKDKIRHDAQVAWNALARLQTQLNEEKSRERSTDEG